MGVLMTFKLSGLAVTVLAVTVLAILLLPISLAAQDEPQESAESGASLETRAVRETEELHQFFQGWFNGTVENTDAVYDRFAGVLAEDFVIVSPSGNLQERANLIEGLRGAYAPEDTEPIRVWVEKAEVRRHWPMPDGDLVLVTYEEWLQRGESSRGRLSTAILREREDTPNGLEWLHVHETWLPLDTQSQAQSQTPSQ